MYFLNDQHKLNFNATKLRWPNAQLNSEYVSASYILAVPMIFDSVTKDINLLETPVDWIYEWESKYGPQPLDNAKKPDFDLSSSMVQLGRLALNLWNGYDHFNLMRCLAVLDEANYEVVKTAMDIRLKLKN